MHTYHTPLDLVRERSPERPVAFARPGAVAVAARWFQENFKGDVFYAVNRQPVNGIADLRTALEQFKSGDSVVLHLERRGELTFLAFTVD